MGDFGMTISQISGAGAYGSAGRLGYAVPVRPVDPVRQRPQVKDDVAAQQANDQSAAANQANGQSAAGDNAARGARANFSLLGALTSFLASMFAQPAGEAAAATSMQAGIQAYARSAGPVPSDQGVEVISPSFPRLSSGRAVDLTV